MPARRTAYTFRCMDLCFDAPGEPSSEPGGGSGSELRRALPADPELLLLISDQLAWPLLLLRADGELLHANRAGHAALAQRSPLVQTPAGRLEPAQARRRRAFSQALAVAAASGPADPAQGMHWPDAGGGCTATLSRLHDDPRAGGAPLLLLALSPARQGREESVRLFADMHGLSAAETRVLRRLALGEGSAQVAAALRVSVATVRTQVLTLRRKSGHASVAAVLRALAAVPPLLPPDGG